MRVRPTERGLQNPVDHIERQIRANLQPPPDRRLRVPEIDPHHEALQLCELGPAQLRASRPYRLSGTDTELRQSDSELSKVIELSSADDRLELAQQISVPVVLAHARTVLSNARQTPATRPWLARPGLTDALHLPDGCISSLRRMMSIGSEQQLRTEIVADSVALAWDQWSQLGVSSGSPAHREERAADPEALLLFTLNVGRNDPRLFDEVLDWLALNEHLVSVHRLRNMCADATDTALVGAALDWSAGARGRRRPPGEAVSTFDLEPLFRSVPTPTENLDESFARHGFARARMNRSGKSQAPRLGDPISFALRLRRLLGVGVRAEVIRALLTIRATRLSGKVITASAAFAQRNVREGLTQLLEAGVIHVVDIADDRHYSIRQSDWATLLALPDVAALPFHYDWIPAYRALTRVVRWLQQPGLEEMSEYLRASQARTLVDELTTDLGYAGFPIGPYMALGVDFWDEFTEIVRALVRQAQGAQ